MIEEFLKDKLLKPKVKTETISDWILKGTLSVNEVINFITTAKDPAKATCIEALEYCTKLKPEIIDNQCFHFITHTLTSRSPRIKWESARVIGNTARYFPDLLEEAINNLLINTEHEGTVVRWSAAYALGEIIKLKTDYNTILLPAIQSIIDREEKNSIKKIYQDAIKKVSR